MPGPWKEWKTKPRYSTLPTVPWKSRIHREISTFPPPRLPAHGKLENQKTVSHFPMRWKRRRLRFPSLLNPNPKKGRRPLRSLLTLPTFRIILYWNQNPVSGSFLDWKMLRRSNSRTLFRAVRYLRQKQSARSSPGSVALRIRQKFSILLQPPRRSLHQRLDFLRRHARLR